MSHSVVKNTEIPAMKREAPNHLKLRCQAGSAVFVSRLLYSADLISIVIIFKSSHDSKLLYQKHLFSAKSYNYGSVLLSWVLVANGLYPANKRGKPIECHFKLCQ